MDNYSELKKKAFETLSQIGLVMAVIDATIPRVKVPSSLRGEIIGLAFGRHLPISIRDLRITEEGFSATLHFAVEGFFLCFIPWDSLIGLRLAGTATILQFNRDLGEIETQWSGAETEDGTGGTQDPGKEDVSGKPRFTLIPGGLN